MAGTPKQAALLTVLDRLPAAPFALTGCRVQIMPCKTLLVQARTNAAPVPNKAPALPHTASVQNAGHPRIYRPPVQSSNPALSQGAALHRGELRGGTHLSKNGTRASTPQAIVDLLARMQSYLCSAWTLRTVSSWNSS